MLHSHDDWPDDVIKWLIEGCAAIKYTEMVPVEQYHRVYEGEAAIYRVSGDAQGIILTSINKNCLYVEMLSGVGFIKHFFAIREQIMIIARSVGLERISGFVQSTALARLYDRRTRAKRAAVLYVEELNNGRS